MSDTVIKVENLSKKYIIGHQKQEKYTALRDVIGNSVKSILKPNSKSKGTKEEFWALKDINFEIKQGDRVGIIGRNGAGKSTLLKILSRITEPTKGQIKIRGRVASLLEVGTGFHPELTGRENIFLNGAILGMGKTEIKKKFDEIVAFAEVEKFLDTPVKRYSSGMYVRLAFAVAAHLEPEILVVDEVLAVGDTQFQKKCLGKIKTVGKEGRTVIFVSHNMGMVQNLCTRGIFLKQGTISVNGDISSVIYTYLQTLENSVSENLLERKEKKGKGLIRLKKIEFCIGKNNGTSILSTGKSAYFIFYVTSLLPKMSCVFTLYNQYDQAIVNFNSTISGNDDYKDFEIGTKLICQIDELILIPGRYRMNVAIFAKNELQDHIENAAIIEIESGVLGGRPITSNITHSSFVQKHKWILPI